MSFLRRMATNAPVPGTASIATNAGHANISWPHDCLGNRLKRTKPSRQRIQIMSPEELEYEITNESMEGLVALIAPLSSSERKKLAKIPVLMKRQRSRQIEQFFQAGVQASLLGLFTGRPETTEADADTALASWQQGWIFQSKIDLAILGLCSWGEAKKIGALSFGAANLTSAQDLVFQILSAKTGLAGEMGFTANRGNWRQALDWIWLAIFASVSPRTLVPPTYQSAIHHSNGRIQCWGASRECSGSPSR